MIVQNTCFLVLCDQGLILGKFSCVSHKASARFRGQGVVLELERKVWLVLQHYITAYEQSQLYETAIFVSRLPDPFLASRESPFRICFIFSAAGVKCRVALVTSPQYRF